MNTTNRRILAVLFTLCLVSLGIAQDKAIDRSRSLVTEFVKENNIPGLSITIAQKGVITWSEGFGYADLEQQVEVIPSETKFRIGSVSKTLAATAIAQLVQAGKLDLDAPIQQYVPSFPRKKWDITIRQLAGHLAGIRHYRDREYLLNEKFMTVEDGLEIFKNDTLLFQPGTQYSYSSYAWNLISAAVENIAGQDFLGYMEQNIFAPVKMHATVPDHQDSVTLHRTRFYTLGNDNTVLNAPAVDNSYKWAGGGFLSTTEDLVRFGNAILQDKLVDADGVKELFAPQETSNGESTGYGIGWRRYEGPGGVWYGHSGGSVGGTTYFIVSPQEDMVVAIVSNLSSVNYDGLHFKIAGLFLR